MRSLSRSPIAHRRQRRQEIKKQLQKEKEQRERQQKEEEEAGGNAGVSMETSGKLLEDTNVVNGVVVKYSEPREARKPKTKWRLYVFKVCHGILISPDFSTLSSLLLTLEIFYLSSPGRGGASHPVHPPPVLLPVGARSQGGWHSPGPPVLLKAARRTAVPHGRHDQERRKQR